MCKLHDEDVFLDFSQTNRIDTAGLAFVRVLSQNGCRVRVRNAGEEVRPALERMERHWQENDIAVSHAQAFSERVFQSVRAFFHELPAVFSILVEMLYWGSVGMLFRRNYRKGVLWEQMYQLGYKATSIVIALTFLIGIAVAAQSIIQMEKFGASVYTMSLVVMGMVRELGPLMVAIIFAGRTGSAITAEIATMSVQEEIDALQTMGINHIQFIVVPKFWAATITIPFLTILGTAFGILGGAVIARWLGGQSWSFIYTEFQKSLIFRDILISLIKSFVFAWLVVWVASYYGFTVRGGAEEVGKKTTASVVASLFVIIIADALFSFVYEMF
ncbi:ABC transporter permease [Chitinivibrio alkaliphilus]|uniref:ABC transporter, permease component n=1 Tax=Chitinivibrio alkaliphilus ACht1 TaxID=1313304 RepID=U7D6B9_9BACT|nr:ABC transporter permease [Chitinivibrio alkaliphilus]ERP31483.1 ABC transporter, permease component [Chitinivibrio alkaliphilus ACht1]